MELSRVVAVEALLPGDRLQIGSGFVVDEGLVLTAAHCTRDRNTSVPAESIRVIRATDGVDVIVGPGAVSAADSADVAAIRLPQPGWTAGLSRVIFGRVNRDQTGLLTDCTAVGYPLFQLDSVHRKRGTAELHGRIYQTDGHEVGRLLMREQSFIPGEIDPELFQTVGGPWGGLSGAVVFYHERAIGVIVEHHPRQGSASVQLAAIDRLVAAEDGAAIAELLGLSSADELPYVTASPLDSLTDLVEFVDADLPTVEEMDPYRLGATTSLAGDSFRYGEADPYVPRVAGQADNQLEQAIHAANNGGPMVVIVGPSKAGKSRTAYEGLRRVLPHARLVAPLPGMLNRLAAHQRWQTTADPIVVWLDDLNRFITHADPLTPSVLAALLRRPGAVTVLATLRSEERERLRSGGELNRDLRMLLEQAREIRLRHTSEDSAETAAAHAIYPNVRLDAGLGAELAGAPELLRQYDDAADADPLRRAVVQTVIDWARAGRPDPIPEPALIALTKDVFISGWPHLDADETQIRAAIATARTPPPGLGRVAMLITWPLANGVRGYRAFDYLVAADDTRRPIAEWFSQRVSQDASPGVLFAVGLVSSLRGDLEAARSWWEKAADAGNIDAMTRLGALLADQWEPPDLQAARLWYQKAADAGDPAAMTNLGVLLQREESPDLSTIRALWEKASNAGNIHAMTNLGSLLSHHWDPLDLTAARAWYERAAAAGDIRAMAFLGALLVDQWDPPDPPAARIWLERAANAGRTDAMMNLAVLHQLQDPPDLEGARAWCEKAADAGSIDAMTALGSLLADFWDPPDLLTARTWYERAAEAGDTRAMANLGMLLTTRWSPPEKAGAREWFEKAADGGNIDAMNNLGILSERQDPPDLRTARSWYEKAAEAGHTDAMTNLGKLLTTRWNPPDLRTARSWYEKAAEAGHTEAMYDLGVLLTDYWHPPDLRTARAWYEKAAEAGHTVAMLNLGALLANRWLPPDFTTARAWYEKAGEAGNTSAMYNLGWLLINRFNPPDIPAARSWWEKGATAGHLPAMTSLAWLVAEVWDPPELSAGREWAEKAANLDHTDAMSWLAYSFLRLSKPPDLTAAHTWYEKAASTAEAQPMYDFGVFLADFSDPPDRTEARRWLQRAADAGHLDAMGYLVLLASRPTDEPDSPI